MHKLIEALCCRPETNITSYADYSSIKNKFKKPEEGEISIICWEKNISNY